MNAIDRFFQASSLQTLWWDHFLSASWYCSSSCLGSWSFPFLYDISLLAWLRLCFPYIITSSTLTTTPFISKCNYSMLQHFEYQPILQKSNSRFQTNNTQCIYREHTVPYLLESVQQHLHCKLSIVENAPAKYFFNHSCKLKCPKTNCFDIIWGWGPVIYIIIYNCVGAHS